MRDLEHAFEADDNPENEAALRAAQVRAEALPIDHVSLEMRRELDGVVPPHVYMLSEAFFAQEAVNYAQAVQDYPEGMLRVVLSQDQVPIRFESNVDFFMAPVEHKMLLRYIGIKTLQPIELVLNELADRFHLSYVELEAFLERQGHPQGGERSDTGLECIASFDNITKLDLSCCEDFSQLDIERVSTQGWSERIQHLNLSGLRWVIDDKWISSEFKEVFGTFLSLKSLDLRRCPGVNMEVALSIDSRIESVQIDAEEKVSIDELTRHDVHRLVRIGEQAKTYEVSLSAIGDTKEEDFRKLREVFPHLTRLELSLFPVSDEAFAEVIGTCSQLEFLKLDQVPHCGAATIAVLKSLPLKNLELIACEAITDHELALIGQIVTLESLHISAILVTDDDLPSFTQLKNLRELSFVGPEGLESVEALISLISELPQLQTLSLMSCDPLEGEIDTLKEAFPHLEIIWI